MSFKVVIYCAIAACLFVGSSLADFEYALDDGAGNWAIGPSQWDAEVLWGNVFDVQPGFETIDALSVSFGSSVPLGRTFTLVVFEDPNDDLSPVDAVPLIQASGLTESTPPNTFLTLSIPETTVSGSFFVACMMDLNQGESVARMDPDTDAGRSWIFFDDAIDLDNLGGSPLFYNMTQTPFNGTWMVRAHGIPEPGTLVFALGVVVVLSFRRLR